MWVHVSLCVLTAVASAASAASPGLLNKEADDLGSDLEATGVDPRFFFIGNTTGLTIELSSLFTGLIAGLGLLLVLAGLAYLIFALAGSGDDSGYSGSSSSYSGSSGHSGRSYVPTIAKF